MSHSTIKLYQNSLILKDKNFLLDIGYGTTGINNAIEHYLSSLTSTTIYNFQYIKHDVRLSIKVNKKQDYLDIGNVSKNINYIAIQNDDDSNPIYYFATLNKQWKSENTVEFLLEMDVLNTIKYGVDYSLGKRTMIRRMHKDRFEPEQDNGYYIRHIDYESEEIPVTLIKRSSQELKDINNVNEVNFSLYYRNNGADTDKPIACFLVPDKTLTTKSTAIPSYTITSTTIPVDNACIHAYLYNSASVYDWDTEQYVSIYKFTKYSYEENGEKKYINLKIEDDEDESEVGIVFVNNSGTLEVYTCDYSPARVETYMGVTVTFPESIRWTKILSGVDVTIENPYFDKFNTCKIAKTDFNGGAGISAAQWRTTYRLPNMVNYKIDLSITSQISYINSIEAIDRTLSTNIKIIYCPYCPCNIRLDNDNYYQFGEMFQVNFTDHNIQLVDYNSNLMNEVSTTVPQIYNWFDLKSVLDTANKTYQDLTEGTDRCIKDSKLYHSDFYQNKFVYDSFNKVFPLECIQLVDYADDVNTEMFNFKFYTSKNLQSKFLFMFPYEYKYSQEDYPNALYVSRNNEGVLYNSEYLNYVRSGYNFDKKNKDREMTFGALNLATSAVSSIASKDPLGFVNSAASFIKNISQMEDNLSRKLQESQLQANSVRNADDYDLLKAYSNNKAKLDLYTVQEETYDALDDLFYYYGYKVNKMGIPQTNTRCWFNYVQADIFIKNAINVDDNLLDLIREKFSQGVTFLHLTTLINSDARFDFEQEKENTETSILDWLNA